MNNTATQSKNSSETGKKMKTPTSPRINSKRNFKPTTNKDIYKKVTDLIIDQLEQGHIAWENPVIHNCRPQNLVTGHIYRGINPLLLSMCETPYFMTFKQARSIKANIKKGAKSLPVVFWSVGIYSKENEAGELEEKKSFLLKYYNVFNLSDIENLPAKYLKKTEFNKKNKLEIQTAEQIINNYKNAPKLELCTGTPHYSPAADVIRTPKKEFFKSSNHYYSTLFHEMGHSTGHKSRLNRFDKEHANLRFGSKDYAKEELTAELTASFLMSQTGETVNIDQRAAYIESWLKVLKNDNKLLISSAGKAEKATNYILNIKI